MHPTHPEAIPDPPILYHSSSKYNSEVNNNDNDDEEAKLDYTNTDLLSPITGQYGTLNSSNNSNSSNGNGNSGMSNKNDMHIQISPAVSPRSHESSSLIPKTPQSVPSSFHHDHVHHQAHHRSMDGQLSKEEVRLH